MTLNDLSPRRKQVAVLYARDRLSATEIAELIGCSPRTVEHHVLEITDRIKRDGFPAPRGGRWLIRRWLDQQAA